MKKAPKRKLGDMPEDSTEEKYAARIVHQAKAKVMKQNFTEDNLPKCLEGAAGNLQWRKGAYFENSKGVASIALVATRMLRDLLYSREQMTSRDIQEMEHFLIYIGGERGMQNFAKELRSIGQNNNATSDTRFRNLFGHDGTFTSAP
ncbi:uncharacterized protein TrAFT101_001465 [Trichoderma asperellum]|uniref:Uncharacterized protein n=1 Tax=Trichoderma asperellum (strain ATCC 204424 / CBS 433.97 / NBRC 101777) TaxID=1042311 RepID=A0A2T3ZDL4_TRIA4|nr:hypothetical protein M441DRAFT_454804 [Trichoderma asperellum CBS 433.97]PTB42889.1 hypothetical protein M441DRAFT_454804 [Trichoderma asperellum CBS 433.97]UKZ85612.1 hypothetical protein TrAFT101_001465 [Trichoderma asperellum]